MKLSLIPILLLASAYQRFTAESVAITPQYSENSSICTTAETAPEIDRLFQGKDSWVGGDGAESVSLGNDRILWLFGDSLIGSISERQRRISTMVNNSISIQKGGDPKTASIKFYTGGSEKTPLAFIRPKRNSAWFWLSHGGIRVGNTLFLFMPQIERVGKEISVWGFRIRGVFMARIANPDEVPNRWVVREIQLPWFHREATGNESYFGISPLQVGKLIYIYGLNFVKSTGNRTLLIARVKTGDLERFSSWEFYVGGRWQKDFTKASGLCDHIGAEFSVSYLPSLGKYVLITTENGLSDKVVMHLANSPEGPWGPPAIIYRAPEPHRDPSLICYAGKAHPELAHRADELIVSYVCNSSDTKKLASDPHLYFPEFVRVRFQPKRPNHVRSTVPPHAL